MIAVDERKMRKKEKIMVFSIIVIAVIIASILIFLFATHEENINDTKKFFGKWKLIDTSYEPMKEGLDTSDTIYEFFENGTLKESIIHYNDPNNKSDTYTHINWNKWNISNGKLLIGNETEMYISYDYHFSNNDKDLRISIPQYLWTQFKRIL